MWWKTDDDGEYFQCPECGYKQKSDAEQRVRCHRCGRSYQKRAAKRVTKQPDDEKGTGFFRYTKNG